MRLSAIPAWIKTSGCPSPKTSKYNLAPFTSAKPEMEDVAGEEIAVI
jgi:hypothetical protein